MAASLVMNISSRNRETSHSALLSLMSQTLHPSQDFEPSDYESVVLIRKASALHFALVQIVSASVALRQRCTSLAQKVSEVQRLGDGMRWKIKKGLTREFSMQMLTTIPRKMRLNASFSLIFRVIDRNGASIKLRENDVFELKVVAAKADTSKRRSTSDQSSLSLIGTTRVFPTFTHEVAFAGISLTAVNAPTVGIRVWLCVTCLNRSEIKPFQLQPFGVKSSAS